jgi:PrgI family protein
MSSDAARDGGPEMVQVVRVPAETDRPDPILAGLTAKQLVVLGAVAALLWAAYSATRAVVPPLAALAVAVPVAGAAYAVVTLSRDGVSIDRLLRAAAAFWRAPRRLADQPSRPVPAWTGLPDQPAVARLRLPVAGIGTDGVLDLGADGAAVVCAASTVNLGLRTPAEQDGLVAAYGGWLNGLTGPVQVLVRADRVNLDPLITELEDGAAELPDPGLEDAALAHAEFLRELSAERDLLRRQVLIVIREPLPAGVTGHAGREAARTRAGQRAAETAAALGALGIRVSVLDGPTAAAVLAAAADPLHPPIPVDLIPEPDREPESDATAGSAESGGRPGGGRRRVGGQLGGLLRLMFSRGPVTTGVERRGSGSAAGLLGVAAGGLEVSPRRVRVGDGWAATLAVTGYPAQVGPAWLEPLTAWPGRLDVCVHVDPIPAPVAAARLRRQLARLESARRSTADRGRLADPGVDTAVGDAEAMAAGLARGEGRLFRTRLYLTVHAATEEDLEADVAAVRGVAASMLLDCVPVSWRALQGWITTLPLGVDLLGIGRTLDTASLAAGFPFSAPDLPAADPATPGAAPRGVLYGVNAVTGGLVVWDRWNGIDNHNTLILARSGAGKSYLAKLDLLRNLHAGVHAQVIDPEDEYGRLAEGVGGTVIRLGAAGVRFNPLDLGGDRRPDVLTRRALFAHTLLNVLLGEAIPSGGRAALDRAIMAAYNQAGITADRRTWRRRAPLLADVAAALAADPDPAGPELAARIEPFVAGSWAGLFDGPTTLQPAGHLVVWSLRDLPDELRPAGTLLALDRIWTDIATGPRRRRLVVVDEAWTLMQSEHGARFLSRMAKAARKRWAGLTVVTQDPADLLGTDLGLVVAANCATQILLRQAPQAAATVADAFGLARGERAWLTTAPQGHALLLGAGGGDRVALQALASDAEHAAITTRPDELDDELDDDLDDEPADEFGDEDGVGQFAEDDDPDDDLDPEVDQSLDADQNFSDRIDEDADHDGESDGGDGAGDGFGRRGGARPDPRVSRRR